VNAVSPLAPFYGPPCHTFNLLPFQIWSFNRNSHSILSFYRICICIRTFSSIPHIAQLEVPLQEYVRVGGSRVIYGFEYPDDHASTCIVPL
jgi:hypothetical protein